MHIIDDTIAQMWQVLEEEDFLLKDKFPSYKSIKYAIKREVRDIAISFIKAFCHDDKKVIKKEITSASNISISEDELDYIMDVRNVIFNREIPSFLVDSVAIENSVFYKDNYKCNICLPLVMCILGMIKRILIEYYYKDEEDVFFYIDEEQLECADDYIQNLLNYLYKNLNTMENTVKFFLGNQEIAAPEKGD